MKKNVLQYLNFDFFIKKCYNIPCNKSISYSRFITIHLIISEVSNDENLRISL